METTEDYNPYVAPEAETDNRPWFTYVGKRPKATFAGWVIVFLVNLPIPLYYANRVVAGSAVTGMAMAVIAILVGGVLVAVRYPRVIQAVSIGGVVTALSQFVPILHIIAGLIAMAIAHGLGLDNDTGKFSADSLAAGFCVTFITAFIVMFVAAAIGAFIQFVRGAMQKKKDSQPVN